jgi:hypothetical protein
MKSEFYKRKMVTPDELLARILDAVVRINKSEDQLQTTRDLRTRVAKCSEVAGGIFGTFFVNCNKLPFQKKP